MITLHSDDVTGEEIDHILRSAPRFPFCSVPECFRHLVPPNHVLAVCMKRRSVLGVGVGSSLSLSGCLFSLGRDSERGNVTCDGETTEPLEDASLPGAVDGSWRTIHGDARNTGARPDTVGPTDCPTTHWNAYPTETNEMVSHQVSFDHPPAVAAGYVVAAGLSSVYAFDADTGALEWRSAVGSGARPALIVDETVYAGSDRELYAFSLSTGAQRWVRQLPSDIREAQKSDCSRVYASMTGGGVRAYDLTGEFLWETQAVFHGEGISEADEPGLGPVAIGAGIVVVGARSGVVAALDAETGERVWERSFDHDVSRAPTIGSERVFVSGYGFLRALDVETGETLWTAYDGEVVLGSPALAERTGTLYVQAGGFLESQNLTAVDVETGEEQWRVPLGLPEASPVVGRDHVYLGAGSELTAIDRETHEIVWEMNPESDIHGHPVLLDGALYVCGVSTGLFAVA